MNEKNYPEPVVGALIYNSKGEIFLMTSFKWPGQYVIPGGHVELGEAITDALVREVKEETGLKAGSSEFLELQEAVFSEEFHKKKRHFILIDFKCKAEGDQTVELNNEGTEYIWIDSKEALKLPLNTFTRRAVLKYLEVENFHGKELKKGIDYIGVSVRAMITNDTDEIFLSKRGEGVRNEKGCWENPGGGVEFGETLEEAIRREIREEYGVEIEVIKQFAAADHLIPAEKQHWVATTFLVKLKEGKVPRIVEKDKYDAIGWFALDNLPQPLSLITLHDLEYFKKYQVPQGVVL